jgi:hypothetical protein
MSKVFQSLFMVATTALALVGSPLAAEARSFPARGGSSSYFSDAACWQPYGAAMTNTCVSPRPWYIPLVLDGSANGWYSARVSAEGGGPSSYVRCIFTTTNQGGDIVYQSGWINLPYYGSPADINLSGWVPGGGTGMIDCEVGPQGKVTTVNY